jgi:predicted ATPase/class 3 adenylate cyclase
LNKVFRRIKNFAKEVWRRNVLHIAIPYGVGSWLILQVADVVFPAFELPNWVFRSLLLVLAAGFPVALVIAWIFNITPKGEITRDTPYVGYQALLESETEPEAIPEPALSLDVGGAERRLVSMLNCSFHTDSLDGGEVDPEDLANALAETQHIFESVIEQYEGFRLPSHSEELSILFGFPQAHDDDARRAVAAGLSLIAKVRDLSESEQNLHGLRLSASATVHSGLVVIDNSKDQEETTVVGNAPRVTAWLQSVAEENTLVISERTHKMVANHFNAEEIGQFKVPQISGKMRVFRVVSGVKADEAMLDLQHQSVEMIGREHELGLLQAHWDQVVDGDGQFALVKGEPGMGKSTIIGAFLRYVRQTQPIWMVRWHCSPYEQSNPLFPAIQYIKETELGFGKGDSEAEKMDKLLAMVERHGMSAEEAVPLLLVLLSMKPNTDYPAPASTSQVQRTRTMELLISMIRNAGVNQPVLLVIEDLLWSDPSTLELLEMLLDQGPAPGVFVLLSARPTFEADWTQRSYVMHFDLNRLSSRSARAIIENTAKSEELPENLIQRIIDETDGIPLFIEELTLALLESDAWKNQEVGAVVDLDKIRIPATLQESLAARLDNLGSAKVLLQVCSMLGRQFSYRLLLAVSETANEQALQDQLIQLVKSELLFKLGSKTDTTYTFKHILIQETAYESLLKSTRRLLHDRIARKLESEFPEIVEQNPQQLAFHLGEANKFIESAQYWTKAARRSFSVSANVEAIEQARTGVNVLKRSKPSRQHDEMEVALQSVLGMALISTKGYTAPEVHQVFTSALKMCERIGDAPEMFQVLVGLWMYYEISAQYDEASELGLRMVRIAESGNAPEQLFQAHYSLGFTQFYQGKYEEAKIHFERAIESEIEGHDYSKQSATADDTRTHVRCVMAQVCWHLGLPITADRYARDAIELARQLKQPYAVTFTSFMNGWLHQFRREPAVTSRYTQECLTLALEHGYRFFVLLANMLVAWSLGEEAGPEKASRNLAIGASGMSAAVDVFEKSGAIAGLSCFSFQLAESWVLEGELDKAIASLDRGWQHLNEHGERVMESEYHRLHGAVCMYRFNNTQAEAELEAAHAHVEKALEVARAMHSRALELRAATDLAEIKMLMDQPGEAQSLLESVIESFAEYDDSGDCVRARDVLEKTRMG